MPENNNPGSNSSNINSQNNNTNRIGTATFNYWSDFIKEHKKPLLMGGAITAGLGVTLLTANEYRKYRREEELRQKEIKSSLTAFANNIQNASDVLSNVPVEIEKSTEKLTGMITKTVDSLGAAVEKTVKVIAASPKWIGKKVATSVLESEQYKVFEETSEELKRLGKQYGLSALFKMNPVLSLLGIGLAGKTVNLQRRIIDKLKQSLNFRGVNISLANNLPLDDTITDYSLRSLTPTRIQNQQTTPTKLNLTSTLTNEIDRINKDFRTSTLTNEIDRIKQLFTETITSPFSKFEHILDEIEVSISRHKKTDIKERSLVSRIGTQFFPITTIPYKVELPKVHDATDIDPALLKTNFLSYVHQRAAANDTNKLLLQLTKVVQTGLNVSGQLWYPRSKTIAEAIAKPFKLIFGKSPETKLLNRFQLSNITSPIVHGTQSIFSNTNAYDIILLSLLQQLNTQMETESYLPFIKKYGILGGITLGGLETALKSRHMSGVPPILPQRLWYTPRQIYGFGAQQATTFRQTTQSRTFANLNPFNIRSALPYIQQIQQIITEMQTSGLGHTVQLRTINDRINRIMFIYNELTLGRVHAARAIRLQNQFRNLIAQILPQTYALTTYIQNNLANPLIASQIGNAYQLTSRTFDLARSVNIPTFTTTPSTFRQRLQRFRQRFNNIGIAGLQSTELAARYGFSTLRLAGSTALGATRGTSNLLFARGDWYIRHLTNTFLDSLQRAIQERRQTGKLDIAKIILGEDYKSQVKLGKNLKTGILLASLPLVLGLTGLSPKSSGLGSIILGSLAGSMLGGVFGLPMGIPTALLTGGIGAFAGGMGQVLGISTFKTLLGRLASYPKPTIFGATMGGLIGLLFGPLGFSIGIAGGAYLGMRMAELPSTLSNSESTINNILTSYTGLVHYRKQAAFGAILGGVLGTILLGPYALPAGLAIGALTSSKLEEIGRSKGLREDIFKSKLKSAIEFISNKRDTDTITLTTMGGLIGFLIGGFSPIGLAIGASFGNWIGRNISEWANEITTTPEGLTRTSKITDMIGSLIQDKQSMKDTAIMSTIGYLITGSPIGALVFGGGATLLLKHYGIENIAPKIAGYFSGLLETTYSQENLKESLISRATLGALSMILFRGNTLGILASIMAYDALSQYAPGITKTIDNTISNIVLNSLKAFQGDTKELTKLGIAGGIAASFFVAGNPALAIASFIATYTILNKADELDLINDIFNYFKSREQLSKTQKLAALQTFLTKGNAEEALKIANIPIPKIGTTTSQYYKITSLLSELPRGTIIQQMSQGKHLPEDYVNWYFKNRQRILHKVPDLEDIIKQTGITAKQHGGTISSTRKLALVGESGPELAIFPPGTKIVPNYKLRLGGTGGPDEYIPLINQMNYDIPTKLEADELILRKYLFNKGIYDQISLATQIPPELIFALHYRESNCDITKSIADGKVPIVDFVGDAINVLKQRGSNIPSTWDLASALDFAEKYNGLGYRNYGILSPYLFAGTNLYQKGKFIDDNVFDPNAVDKQLGVAVLLSELGFNDSNMPIQFKAYQMAKKYGLNVYKNLVPYADLTKSKLGEYSNKISQSELFDKAKVYADNVSQSELVNKMGVYTNKGKNWFSGAFNNLTGRLPNVSGNILDSLSDLSGNIVDKLPKLSSLGSNLTGLPGTLWNSLTNILKQLFSLVGINFDTVTLGPEELYQIYSNMSGVNVSDASNVVYDRLLNLESAKSLIDLPKLWGVKGIEKVIGSMLGASESDVLVASLLAKALSGVRVGSYDTLIYWLLKGTDNIPKIKVKSFVDQIKSYEYFGNLSNGKLSDPSKSLIVAYMLAAYSDPEEYLKVKREEGDSVLDAIIHESLLQDLGLSDTDFTKMLFSNSVYGPSDVNQLLFNVAMSGWANSYPNLLPTLLYLFNYGLLGKERSLKDISFDLQSVASDYISGLIGNYDVHSSELLNLKNIYGLGNLTYFWPPTSGTVTSLFGELRSGGAIHKGIDIAAPLGSPIASVLSGVVVEAGPAGAAGNRVVIDTGNGLLTSYLHLDKIAVSPGQRVSVGDVIGTVGNTGRSTGPHLDFRIATKNENAYFDPAVLFQTLYSKGQLVRAGEASKEGMLAQITNKLNETEQWVNASVNKGINFGTSLWNKSGAPSLVSGAYSLGKDVVSNVVPGSGGPDSLKSQSIVKGNVFYNLNTLSEKGFEQLINNMPNVLMVFAPDEKLAKKMDKVIDTNKFVELNKKMANFEKIADLKIEDEQRRAKAFASASVKNFESLGTDMQYFGETLSQSIKNQANVVTSALDKSVRMVVSNVINVQNNKSGNSKKESDKDEENNSMIKFMLRGFTD